MNKSKVKKCSGSGTIQMLDWLPDDSGYPGAAVCIQCSQGVMVVKGSVRKAVSAAGFEGLSGKLRVHKDYWNG